MAGGYDDRWQRFAPTKPRPVKDGLATSKQRGAMADNWWSKRFTQVLDSYGLGGRMQRGRRYARTGQVMTLEVEPGMLVAQVQGSRSKPYLVSIRLAEVADDQWTRIEETLADRVGLISALLAGEVPEELEPAFDAAGVALFPQRWADLRASCNCPDSASPCKHLAAVLYVFADHLDSDPWLLLTWRGRTRDEILDLIRTTSPGGVEIAPWWPFAPGPVPDAVRFAEEQDAPAALLGGAAVLDRLEQIDLVVLGTPLYELLDSAYAAFADAGLSDDIELPDIDA